MIFVVLGTQKFQLNRLLMELDELCETGRVNENIFAQIGHSDYLPQKYDYIDFMNRELFLNKINESSLVITHSGVGSIVAALNANKPIIVYPRLCKYREHVDDHQLEIAKTFSRKNFVLLCDEGRDLGELICKAMKHRFDKYVSSTGKVIEIVKKEIERG